MTDDEDGFLNLSLPQKLQLGVFGAGTLIFLLTYLVSVLLNGTQYINQWILNNPVPVAAYWFLQIALIPVYRNADLTRIKYIKQSIHSFILSGLPFALFIIYYQIYPPETWVDGTVYRFSLIIASATIFNLVISSGFYQYGKKD